MLRITNNFFYHFSVAKGRPSYQMVKLFNCIGYIGKRKMNSWWRVPTTRWMCTTRRGTGRASWELRTRIPPSTGCAEPTKCSTSSWKKNCTSLIIESSWPTRTLFNNDRVTCRQAMCQETVSRRTSSCPGIDKIRSELCPVIDIELDHHSALKIFTIT